MKRSSDNSCAQGNKISYASSDTSPNDPAQTLFRCSRSERAAFEAGIKMGSLFHQFVGTPLSLENISSLEKAIEEACCIQPFVIKASVKIRRDGLSTKMGTYDYTTLSGDMLDVALELECNDIIIGARLAYIEELEYPLMWISHVSDEKI